MADIYFKLTTTLSGQYWRLVGVQNIKPSERSLLSLTCQEYLAVSGDIGSDEGLVSKALAELRKEMEQSGSALHYDPPVTEGLALDVVHALLEDDDEEYIGVDFDGTLAKYTTYKGPTKLGEPIKKMVARVRRWVSHGKKVKIFTSRADDEKSVNAIKKWLKDNELPDLEVTNLKDEKMTELWDDRAIAVKKNTGEVKEAYEDWWEPDQPTLSWFFRLLQHLEPVATWAVPSTGQIYKIDQPNRVVTLVSGEVNDPEGWHDKTKKVFRLMGYTVHDHPPEEAPEEQGFAENLSPLAASILFDDLIESAEDIWNEYRKNPFGLRFISPYETDKVEKVARELILRHWDRNEDLVDVARELSHRHFPDYGPNAFEDLIGAAHSLFARGEGHGEPFAETQDRHTTPRMLDESVEKGDKRRIEAYLPPSRRHPFGRDVPDKRPRTRRPRQPVEPPPTDPHARAVHDAGGKLISVNLGSPEQWKRELARYTPGCGSPTYPYGPEAGAVPCGAKMTDLSGKTTTQFCPYCHPDIQEGVILNESPEIKTLKDNARALDPEERAEVMKAGAVWHHGPDGEATPAVRKAVINGKTWYWCATHRAGQVKSTLKAAIKAFDFVKTTS